VLRTFNTNFPSGVSARFQVMTSPYEASRSHSLDTLHSVGLLRTISPTQRPLPDKT